MSEQGREAQYRWRCQHKCWAPALSRPERCESEGRRYGCTHDGWVEQRLIVKTFGDWVRVSSLPVSS